MDMKIIDMHCDTIGELIARSEGKICLARNEHQIDIEKLEKGGALAQFFAIFILTNEQAAKAKMTLSPYEYFNLVYDAYIREIRANSTKIAPAMNYDDIMMNKRMGKMSSILTIEDGVPVDGKMERITEFYEKGVRLISFTWNYENSLGYPNSKDPELMKLGLKPFGIDVVKHMNYYGMLVDVSHLSDGGFWDVVQHSDKPFVASHSCCRALCNHTRNLTDEMLKAIGEKGGAVGINFASQFLNEGSNDTDIASIVRHMVHIKEKAGIDAVAFGSDFDGISSKLEFVDYAGMPLIVRELEKQFSPSEIEKICSANMLRVIKETLK